MLKKCQTGGGGGEGGLPKDQTFSGFSFVHPSLIVSCSKNLTNPTPPSRALSTIENVNMYKYWQMTAKMGAVPAMISIL